MTNRARAVGGLGVFALIVGLAAGCAGGDAPSATDPATSGDAHQSACTPGKQETCACPGSKDGVQVCSEDGTGFEKCACDDASGATSSGGDPCGDGTCGADESCHTCEADCGACAPCTAAPSCAGAMIPPVALDAAADLNVKLTEMPPDAILARLQQRIAEAGPAARVLASALARAERGESALTTHLRGLFDAHPVATEAVRRQLARAGMPDAGAYRGAYPEIAPSYSTMGDEFPPGGSLACGAPMLRIRVAQVTVHEEDDDFANDIVYCAVVSEGADGGEVRVTPETPNLDEGDSYSFSVESGVMWGQHEPRSPGGNLMITYDCFEADSSDGYKNLVDGVAKASTDVGGILNDNGDQGWIFEVAGAVVPIVTDALVLDSDDHLFNATQIIPVEKDLDLTNGRFWTVRREGTHLNSDWDWELRIEAWGCAEYGE